MILEDFLSLFSYILNEENLTTLQIIIIIIIIWDYIHKKCELKNATQIQFFINDIRVKFTYLSDLNLEN